MKALFVFLVGSSLALAESAASQPHQNGFTNRLEFVTGVNQRLSKGFNFFETQAVHNIGHIKLVHGVEALGFATTKLVGWRSGVAMKVKNFSFAPSMLLVHDTEAGRSSAGLALRFEDEFLGDRLYVQGFIGLYRYKRPGRNPNIWVLDPVEVAYRPFSKGEFKNYSFGIGLEKWNGEQILAFMGSRKLPGGLEVSMQYAPPTAAFQNFGHASESHLGHVVRIGVVWKQQPKTH